MTLKNISIRCIYGELPKNMNDFIDEDRTNIILVDKDGYTVENIPDFMLGGNERTKVRCSYVCVYEGVS